MSKTPDTKLFELIKSLSQTEKRYFKVGVGASGGNNSHQFIELFDCIASMDNYDENELKKALNEGKGAKHLAFRKSHLYDTILSSLRNYHKNKSTEFQVLNLLQDIKITFDRGLFLQSEKLLKKLKRICKTYNLNQYLISVTFWEQKLIGNLKGKAFIDESKYETEKVLVQALINEQQELLSYLKKGMKFWSLRIALLDLYRFEEAGLKKPIEQFKNELIACLNSDPPNQNHFEFIVQTHTINSMIYYFEGNYNASVNAQKKLIHLLEKEQKFIKNNINNYASEINNFLAASFDADKTADVEKWLGVLKALLSNIDVRSNVYLNSRIFSFYQINSLRYYNYQSSYQESLDCFDRERYLRLKKYINPYKHFQLQYNMAVAYFFRNDFHEALKWINSIVNSSVKVRPMDMSFIRVLLYLTHFKRGNFFIIENACNSKDKTIRINVDSNPPEKLIATYLTKISLKPNTVKELQKKLISEYDNAVTDKNSIHKDLLIFLKKELLK